MHSLPKHASKGDTEDGVLELVSEEELQLSKRVIDPSEYVDKQVTVTYRDQDGLQTVTGTVTQANSACMLVRPKGKSIVLIDADDIASLKELETPAPKIKVRSMERILPENTRQHLADRHGWPLMSIPDKIDMAVKIHDELSHGQLGHIHRPTVDEVDERAAVLDLVAREGGHDEIEDYKDLEDYEVTKCEHYGIECLGLEDCNCQCADCMGNEE